MKKGFTLIELLAVLILLAVIGLITLPIINNSINNSRERALEETIKNIEHAALTYSVENYLGMDTNYKSLTLEELKTKGYLENKDIINPVTKEEMTGCILYKWESNQYNFKYSDECEVSITYEAGDLLKIQVGTNETRNFYVLKDNGDTLTVIMDRNLGDDIAWASDADGETYVTNNNIDTTTITTPEQQYNFMMTMGPITANKQLNSLTSNWSNVTEKRLPSLIDIFEHTEWYKGLTDEQKTNFEEEYTTYIDNTVMANESLQTAMSSCETNECYRTAFKTAGYEDILVPTWLDINLYTSGDNTQDTNGYYKYAYWTSDVFSANPVNAWFVVIGGFVDRVDVVSSVNAGVRPVITINESDIIEKLGSPVYVDDEATE